MDISDVFFNGGTAFFFFVQSPCILRKQLGGDISLIHGVLSFRAPYGRSSIIAAFPAENRKTYKKPGIPFAAHRINQPYRIPPHIRASPMGGGFLRAGRT